jgi:hypothetical protein
MYSLLYIFSRTCTSLCYHNKFNTRVVQCIRYLFYLSSSLFDLLFEYSEQCENWFNLEASMIYFRAILKERSNVNLEYGI